MERHCKPIWAWRIPAFNYHIIPGPIVHSDARPKLREEYAKSNDREYDRNHFQTGRVNAANGILVGVCRQVTALVANVLISPAAIAVRVQMLVRPYPSLSCEEINMDG